ncbi:hypothetical protein ANCDUO_07314 [Ancylostoma duodenale]|uniref:Peptidase M13 N-terminal domain-containing protein n=1 Tax=Ancylostoma duodenale TaxID=51022 RepID=A0A0C2GMF4_9BILA|nr:hypothetical protein ANCDUO_07314 [Ancylostoma duodenale]
MVDTNWPEPKKGYTMFLDQNTAFLGTDAETRRSYPRSWNPRSIEQLREYSFVDWQAYMRQPEQFEKMTRDYLIWDQTKLVNYLFMRLVLSNAQYLPSYASGFDEMPEEPIVLGRRRPYFRFPKRKTIEDAQLSCVGLANQLMPYAIGRVYIDYEYPDNDKKQLIRK